MVAEQSIQPPQCGTQRSSIDVQKPVTKKKKIRRTNCKADSMVIPL